jgi:tetratricopeptide (TPR) repeat protein
LRLSALDELSSESRKLDLLRLSSAIIEEAVNSQPSNPMNSACLLELGNVAQSRGDHHGAIYRFDRLVREFPRSPLLVPASYNMALSYRQLGDLAAARDALYRLVDESPLHRLAQLAYIQIGRIYLQEGEPDRAITPFRRACAQSSGGTRAAAATGLATSFILHGNPRAGNLAIVEYRRELSEPPFDSLAAFLSALSRFRAMPARQDNQPECRALLASLLAVRKEKSLGPVETLLAGQAFRELAMDEEMVALYESAMKDRTDIPGWIGAEMNLALADVAFSSGQTNKAVARLTELAKQSDNPWAPVAMLRLAEMALRERRNEDCLHWCRSAAESQDARVCRDALKLMGRTYEQLGQHKLAAACYAGQIPQQTPP